jgi:hypothetical protein
LPARPDWLGNLPKPDFSGGGSGPAWLDVKLDRGRRGWALPYTDRMVSYESGKAFDSAVATRQRASAPTYWKLCGHLSEKPVMSRWTGFVNTGRLLVTNLGDLDTSG